eukprot:TRINITY_DN123362_c0_g1_i1.p1 TRINITY_DN123362_c0_g1~~TRINITY_DN123362_c0_g1_i1.p1  ORF type:complete len:261 (+),score=48.81 TRINITY_DN123362_c0_g1_i1:76-783(+)
MAPPRWPVRKAMKRQSSSRAVVLCAFALALASTLSANLLDAFVSPSRSSDASRRGLERRMLVHASAPDRVEVAVTDAPVEERKAAVKDAPPAAEKEAEAKEEGEGHLSISQLLQLYGLPAVVFHFLVWVTCLGSVYALLSVYGIDAVIRQLPEFVQEKLSGEGGSGSAGGLGAAAVTVALVEAVGPARFALTVASAPTVSKVVRQNEWFCSMEDLVNSNLRKFLPQQPDAQGAAK